MPKAIYQLFFFLHCLSIDVAVGAVAMLYALLTLFPSVVISLQHPLFLLLFLGTLLVYWIDHLQDSAKAKMVQANARKKFFIRFGKFLKGLVVLNFVACSGISIYFLSLDTLLWGALLALAMLAYLVYHRKLKRMFLFEKELIIAGLYALSLVFVPMVLMKAELISWKGILLFVLGIQLFLTALQNLFSLAILEQEADALEGNKSILQLFGSDRLRRLQIAMLVLQGALSLVIWFIQPHEQTWRYLGIMMLISLHQYLLPLLFPNPKNDAYRIVGDGLFLLGFFVL